MTITIERPTIDIREAEARPISAHPTRRVAIALAAVEELLGRVDYARLPDIHAVQVANWTRGPETLIQLASACRGDAVQAADVLAWRNAAPGGRVTLVRCGADAHTYWRASAVLPAAGAVVEVWTHLHGLTEAQAERLERDPQTAYAVLTDIAGEAR